MPRSLVIFLVAAGIIAVLGLLGVPALKQKLFGGSMLVQVKIPWAVESDNVGYQGATVSRTIVRMEIFFPSGGAPDSVQELQINGESGGPVEVKWGTPEIDNVEGGVRWTLPKVFLPVGFREGMLSNKTRALCYIRLPKVEKED